MILALVLYVWAVATFYLTFEVISFESVYDLDWKDKLFNAFSSVVWPIWILAFCVLLVYFKFFKK